MTVWQVKWTVDLNWLLLSLCVWIHLGLKYLMLTERPTAGTPLFFFIDFWFIDGLLKRDTKQLNMWFVTPCCQSCLLYLGIHLRFISLSLLFSRFNGNLHQVCPHHSVFFFCPHDLVYLCLRWHLTNSVTCTAASTVHHYNCWKEGREWWGENGKIRIETNIEFKL